VGGGAKVRGPLGPLGAVARWPEPLLRYSVTGAPGMLAPVILCRTTEPGVAALSTLDWVTLNPAVSNAFVAAARV